jgi:hypothetical protein
MDDAKLTVQINGQFKNIYLNEKEELQVEGIGKVSLPKLREGRFIIVEKTFALPKEVVSKQFKNADGSARKSYIYRVKYNGEEVSFFLNRKNEVDALNALGTIGSKIKITADLYDNKFNGKSQNFKFELVQ